MYSNGVLALEDSIKAVLRQLGIIQTYKGHAYLVETVKYAYEDIEIDKVLYTAIAEKYSAKRESVYNDIRICIRRAQRVNPAFLTTLIDSPTDYRLPLLRDFILSIVSWVKTHHAILVYPGKSKIGKIEWIEKREPISIPE
jgi:hypothetical protein